MNQTIQPGQGSFDQALPGCDVWPRLPPNRAVLGAASGLVRAVT
jgi:hypothetical protein